MLLTLSCCLFSSLILAYFPYLKNKWRFMRSPCCLSACLPSVYVYLSIYGSTALVDLNRFLSFLTPWEGDQPVARPLPTHRTTRTQNKRTHRHPCLEWDSNPGHQCSSGRRRLHALDRAIVVIGYVPT
jgi:hypothetical protein